MKASISFIVAASALSLGTLSEAFSPSSVTIGNKDIRSQNRPSIFKSSSIISSGPFKQASDLSSSALSALDPISAIESTTSILSSSATSILSNENIKQAFSLATFGPQYLWLLMILAPNTKITKKIMGGYGGILVFSFIHLFIVIASASQDNGTAPIAEFSGVFDPAPEADPQGAMIGMMRYPNFVTEEWSHVLTWDLFVGRWIWLDGLKRGIFTPHSVLLCNLIGPPGFLLHCATCLVTGKGIVGNEAEALEEKED